MSSLLNRKLQKALDCFGRGDMAAAESACREVLRRAPRLPEALHLLGVIRLHSGHAQDAVELIARALAGSANDPLMLGNLGMACLSTGDFNRAEQVFRRALEINDADPIAHMRLGIALVNQGRKADAIAAFRAAETRAPGNPDVQQNLANVLADQGQIEPALEAYRRAAALRPDSAVLWFNIGVLCQKLERFDEASAAYGRTLEIDASHRGALNNLGWLYRQTGQFERAAEQYRTLISLDPDDAGAHHNLGIVMRWQGRLDQAGACYQRALALNPGFVDAWIGLGVVRELEGRPNESIDCFRKALAIDPSSTDARFSLAITYLAKGDLDQGWTEYGARETRVLAEHDGQIPRISLPATPCPILLLSEQGLGDELFFLRFAPALRHFGFTLHCQCDRRIVEMVKRTGLFESVVASDDPLPEAGLKILVGDLPRFLLDWEERHADRAGCDVAGINGGEKGMPRHRQFAIGPLPLRPLSEHLAVMQSRIQALGSAPYIGVTWRAGTPISSQHARVQQSLCKQGPFEELAPILRSLPGTLLSLQRRPEPGETERFSGLIGRELHDFSAVNDDLEAMLALMRLLDDYVGVSNTNMHLRAGVGRSARVLVPHPPEWRWMTEGAIVPWFPGFIVYRQAINLDWAVALNNLRADLSGSLGFTSR